MNRLAWGIVMLVALAAPTRAQYGSNWHTPFPSFKIAGHLYYVGTADLAAYLVRTPQGNILINSNFVEDLPALKKSIADLGFKYEDTKVILISHAHDDHDGAVGLIQRETGARVMVMDGDVSVVANTYPGFPGARVDRVLHDLDTVELGGTTLTARLTPGHTEGCTTWTMRVAEGDRALTAVIVGSATVNYGYILVDNQEYPAIAQDYEKTFTVLKSLPADIFLGAHGEYFGLQAKYDALKSGAATNPFVDPSGYKAYVAERERAFRAEWEQQKR